MPRAYEQSELTPTRRPRPKTPRRVPTVDLSGYIAGPTLGQVSLANTLGPTPRAVTDAGIPNMRVFNQRLDAVVRVHRRVFGTTPTPGFAWDLVRLDMDERGYERLLRVPTTRGRASVSRALATLQAPEGLVGGPTLGGVAFLPDSPVPRTITPEIPDELARRQFGPTSAGVVNPADVARGARQGMPAAALRTPEARAFAQEQERLAASASGISTLFFREGGEFLRNLPFGVYETVKAGASDLTDFATAIGAKIIPEVYRDPNTGRVQEGSFLPKRTVAIAEQVGRAIWEDIQNPTEHPFNLTMDIFGIATAGAGTVTRLSRATGSLRAGEPEMAVLNLLRRPVPDTYTLGVGLMSTQIPRFENVALNLITEPIRRARQEGLARRLGGEPYDTAPARSRAVISRYLSTEAKLRRARFAEDAFRYKLDTVSARQLERIVRSRSVSQIVLRQALADRDASLLWKATPKRGKAIVDKVVELAHLPVEDPLAVMRAAHMRAQAGWEDELVELRAGLAAGEIPNRRLAEAMIQDADEAIRFHGVELRLLDDAEQLMAGQAKRLDPIVRKAAEVSRIQQEGKVLLLGWDHERLANHLLEEAAFYQGLDYVPGEGFHLAGGEVLKLPGRKFLDGAPRKIPFNVDPFYVPTRSQLYANPSVFLEGSTRGRGQLGLSPVQEPTRWHHQWTGQSFESGRRRIDTSDLLVEEGRMVVKFALQRDQWEAVWSVGRETPRGIPAVFVGVVRDINQVPDHLRQAVQVIQKDRLRTGEARGLTDGRYDEVMEWLFPRKEKIQPGENVRYVDKRNIPEMAGLLSPNDWRVIDRVMSSSTNPLTWLNETARITYLFARLAYAVNFLGSGTLALIKQGPLAFENLLRAVQIEKTFGEYGAQVIRDAAGSGRSLSYATEQAAITKVSQTMAHFWGAVTDNKWREAAVIHELRRKDIRSEDGTSAEFFDRIKAGDAQTRALLNETRIRANKAMVNFDNLSWPEKAILRHFFFVYAWVSRSAVYSLHYLAEHPVQADWFSHAGEDYEETVQRLIGKVPEWFTRGGYIPIWKGFVSNPLQFNTPGSIAEVGYPLASLFTGVKYAEAEETLDPSVKLLIDALTGASASSDGVGGTLLAAAKEAFMQTPFGQALARSQRDDAGAGSPPVIPGENSGVWSMLRDAVLRERSGEDQASFETDGFWNQWGLLISSSVAPREANELALRAKYWRDMRESDPAAYVRHQVDSAQAMLTRQGKLLSRPVTDDLSQGVKLLGLLAEAEIRVLDESGMEGNDLGARSKLVVAINVLRNNGYITADERRELLKEAKSRSVDPAAMRLDLLLNQGKLGALNEWVRTVKDVGEFRGQKLDDAVQALADTKLGAFNGVLGASEETRTRYGVQVVGFLNERAELDERLKDEDSGVRAAALNAFDADRDKPVAINGVTFPSLARAAWAMQTPQEREDSLFASANARTPNEWAEVSPVVREALGRPTTPRIVQAWSEFSRVVADYRAAHPGERVTREQKWALARQINQDRRYTGFLVDYEFSQRTPLRRFMGLSVYQRSDNRKQWATILAAASQAERALEQARTGQIGYTMTQVRKFWAQHVNTKLLPWIESQGGSFAAEVDGMGESWLRGMIG